MFLRAQSHKRLLQASTSSLLFASSLPAPKHRLLVAYSTKQAPSSNASPVATPLPSSPYTTYRYARQPPASHQQQSGTAVWAAVIVLGIAVGGAFFLPPFAHKTPDERPPTRDSGVQFDLPRLTDSYLVMAPNTPPGRPGTLTPDEEMKLRELWAMTLKVFGTDITAVETNGTATNGTATNGTVTNGVETNGIDSQNSAAPADASSEKDGKKEKKKSRLNVFKRNKDDKSTEPKSEVTTPTDTTTTTSNGVPDISKITISAEDDKHGISADFKAALANTPPEELRRAFWSMVKHDHPDALLLRFLRARKWDTEKALVMMISAMQWRLNGMHVDDDIMLSGEMAAVEDAKAGDTKTSKHSEDFLTQLRMGKSFLHGLDNMGRPMCFIRVRLHRGGEQSEQSLERFTVYLIETARMLLRPPIDTATIVFDMTDFSLANMDYTPVKFMIKCFEANYPESLGTVLVYRAPWVFNAIWTIIRGWLDPVVANKVHFARDVKELEKFINKDQMPTELGGDEKWTYDYPEPVPGENKKMEDTVDKEELQSERAAIVKRYETSLIEWVRDAESKSLDERRKERDTAAEELRVNYWKLDPYVRARSLYDRLGILGEGGKLDFYPSAARPAEVSEKTTREDEVD